MEEKGIVVKQVYKSFGKHAVLENVSFQVKQGQIFGLVGNNGSGKTVLMKCICGFLKADQGEILVNGKRIGVEVDFPESIGAIIETPGFISDLTGFQNLKLLASLKGKIERQEIMESMKQVGLQPGMKKPVSKYSLGMRQRLGIAQAIMENPDILILDEPFTGWDKEGVLRMRELLKELKRQGKAMILASHNGQDIEELCDVVHDMEEKWQWEG